MYTTYIKGYDNAMALYHDQINNNMKFSQLVKEFEVGFQRRYINCELYPVECSQLLTRGGVMV